MTLFKTKNKLFLSIQVFMVLAFAITMVAAIHPEARTSIRDTLLTDYRVLVSSTQAEFGVDGTRYTVVKVKTRTSLVLEIYKNEIPSGEMKLVEKIEMPEARDGYFNFDGSATNLALADVDDDGRLEILAPSFDRDLVGRLNIFRFNPDSNALEKIVN